MQPLDRLKQHLIGAPGLGRNLPGDAALVGLSKDTPERAVDRGVELRAVGLGDQHAIAPALADRIDVWRVEAIAHHDLAAVAELAQLPDQVAAIHRLG